MLSLSVAGLGLLLLAWVWWREQGRVARVRGELLADCLGLLERPVLVRDGLDYPVLRGRFAGCGAEIRPLADSAALRKLPALWLQVTLTGATGAPGVLDALRRPLGTEYWSPARDLPAGLPTPDELPADAELRFDRQAALALLPALQAQSGFLHRPEGKEVLITPKGVRLVVLLAEAERGSYLLFRDAQFAIRRLDPAYGRELLDRAARLVADVRSLAAGAGLDAAA